MDEEIWKDIEGYEGMYQVSTLGRVKSLDRVITNKNGVKAKKEGVMLIQRNNHKGYPNVAFSKPGINPKRCSIHRLVGLAFISNPENKPQINHINGIKTDNRVENLEWNTALENNMHAIKVLNRKAANSWLGKKG